MTTNVWSAHNVLTRSTVSPPPYDVESLVSDGSPRCLTPWTIIHKKNPFNSIHNAINNPIKLKVFDRVCIGKGKKKIFSVFGEEDDVRNRFVPRVTPLRDRTPTPGNKWDAQSPNVSDRISYNVCPFQYNKEKKKPFSFFFCPSKDVHVYNLPQF